MELPRATKLLPLLPLLLLLLLPAGGASDSVADFLESMAAGPAVNCSTFAEQLHEVADSVDGLRLRLRRLSPLMLERVTAAAAAAAAGDEDDESRDSCQLVANSQVQRQQKEWRHSLQVGCVRAAESPNQLRFDGLTAETAAAAAAAVAGGQLAAVSSLPACAARHLLDRLAPRADKDGDADAVVRRRRRAAASSSSSSSADASLAAGVGRFVSRMPRLQASVQQQVNSRRISGSVLRITRRGFETFSTTAALQAVEGVERRQYWQFADYLLDSLDVAGDVRAEIRRGVFELTLMAGTSDWQEFKMLFKAGRGGRTKFVSVLAHRGADGFNFVVADFRTTFSLAPDLIVVEKSSSRLWGAFGSSETVIRRVPASITDADVEALMSFFNLAAFKRFAEMLQIPIGRRQRRAVATTFAAINAGISTYSKFAKAFKTKRTSRIVGKIVGKGFDHFAMKSRVHVISRLGARHLNWYLSRVHRLYGLPRNREVRDVLQLIRFAGFQEWNKNDFLFDVGSGGHNAWVTVLAHRNEDNTYNFIVATVRQKFRLAPNVLIIKKSKSVLGGIYESEKFEFKRMPRSITEADLQMLMNFFNIVTFKRFGMKFDVDTSKLNG